MRSQRRNADQCWICTEQAPAESALCAQCHDHLVLAMHREQRSGRTLPYPPQWHRALGYEGPCRWIAAWWRGQDLVVSDGIHTHVPGPFWASMALYLNNPVIASRTRIDELYPRDDVCRFATPERALLLDIQERLVTVIPFAERGHLMRMNRTDSTMPPNHNTPPPRARPDSFRSRYGRLQRWLEAWQTQVASCRRQAQ